MTHEEEHEDMEECEEEEEQDNPWDVDVEGLYPSSNYSSQVKDELIRTLEHNADDQANRILRNFSASLGDLCPEEIEEISLLYELYTYCLMFADQPLMCIEDSEVYALKMRSLQNKIALSRSKRGKMLDLFMKHHQVITQNVQNQTMEPDKPTWYKRMFGFK
jgi:hypothetical protein